MHNFGNSVLKKSFEGLEVHPDVIKYIEFLEAELDGQTRLAHNKSEAEKRMLRKLEEEKFLRIILEEKLSAARNILYQVPPILERFNYRDLWDKIYFMLNDSTKEVIQEQLKRNMCSSTLQ